MKVRSLPALALLGALTIGCDGLSTSFSSSATDTQGAATGSSQQTAIKPQELILGKWRLAEPDVVVTKKDSTTGLRKGAVYIVEFKKDGSVARSTEAGQQTDSATYRVIDARTLEFSPASTTSKGEPIRVSFELRTMDRLLLRDERIGQTLQLTRVK